MTLDLATSAGLTAAVTVLLTFVAVIVPKVRTWFEAKDADTQRSIRGVIVLALATAFVGGSCAGFLPGPACTVQAIGDYVIGAVLSAVLSLASSDGIFLAARLRANRKARLAFKDDGLHRWVQSPAGKLLG